MSTVLFDTFEAAKKLEGAGFNPTQTEVLVRTIHHAVNENVATKADLKEHSTKTESNLEVGLMRTENRITWRVGVMLAVAVATLIASTQILITLNGLGMNGLGS